jgi:hypothetical protein
MPINVFSEHQRKNIAVITVSHAATVFFSRQAGGFAGFRLLSLPPSINHSPAVYHARQKGNCLRKEETPNEKAVLTSAKGR